MNFNSWISAKVKKLNWTDFSLIKLSVAGFVLAIAKLWGPILSLDWYWYVVIFILAAALPLKKILK
ncbi:MAG: hypothetical protein V1678_01435 [Candidatus Aenigmatarchaeota archaeon]